MSDAEALDLIASFVRDGEPGGGQSDFVKRLIAAEWTLAFLIVFCGRSLVLLLRNTATMLDEVSDPAQCELVRQLRLDAVIRAEVREYIRRMDCAQQRGHWRGWRKEFDDLEARLCARRA